MKTKVGGGKTKAKVCQGGDERRGGTRGGAMENFEKFKRWWQKEKENLENEKLAAGKKRLQNRTQWSGGPVSVFLTAAPNFCSAVCLRRGKSKVLVLTSQSTVGPQNCLSVAAD